VNIVAVQHVNSLACLIERLILHYPHRFLTCIAEAAQPLEEPDQHIVQEVENSDYRN
jgi:hypothetical protein